MDLPTKHGDKLALQSHAIACPNDECKELFLVAYLKPYRFVGNQYQYGEALESWQLRPQGAAKVFPDYVPAPIIQDYREACLIRDLSPKASATLSRRCLQGMIRDFWKIQKDRLKDEIDALEEKVDPGTWKAIDAVRQIGNIGAHMEKDINLVLDVDPEEATLLIELVETLIEDWYVERHERERRVGRIVDAAAAKKAAKQQPAKPEPSAEPKGEPDE